MQELQDFDFGIAFSGKYANEPIPTLGQVLAFAKANPVVLEFDNILEFTPKEQRDIFYREVKAAHAEASVGLTAKTIAFARKIISEFPDMILHYDGLVNAENLKELSTFMKRDKLISWIPIEKKDWLPYPPADPETVALAKEYGEVGLWSATDMERFRIYMNLGADVMESDGTVTLDMLK